MQMFARRLTLELRIALLSVLLMGCISASVAAPTPTEGKPDASTHWPIFTASPPGPSLTTSPTVVATLTTRPTLPQDYTPTATSTISPSVPEPGQIVIGIHYSYYPGTPDHDQATAEFVDVTAYRNKLLVVETDTQGHSVRLGLYRGKIDLSQWWGDSAPFILETPFQANSSARAFVMPSDSIISVVYITRPVANNTPENLAITRKISVQEPALPPDLSQTFVTAYWTFPDSIFSQLVNPPQFNDNMNRAYAALKELVGRDSVLLDADGHVWLIVEDIPACGWAGNPIQMHPVCMGADVLNTGNPGWGPVHELGHDFLSQDSYDWGETDSAEGWANFMAFYCYDNKVFINSDYDQAFWDNVWVSSPKPTDIFQGLIVTLSHQSGWNIAKTFFRKYIAADPARDQSAVEKQKQAVRYLAESALEVTGRQDQYDFVVDYLTQKGFPQP